MTEATILIGAGLLLMVMIFVIVSGGKLFQRGGNAGSGDGNQGVFGDFGGGDGGGCDGGGGGE